MLSQRQIRELDQWLAAVLQSPRRAIAIFSPEHRPGRPWDEYAVLERARSALDGLEMQYAFTGAPIDLRVGGVDAVARAEHPWSANALLLSGNIQCEQCFPQSPFLGLVPRPPRRIHWQCPSLWLVA